MNKKIILLLIIFISLISCKNEKTKEDNLIQETSSEFITREEYYSIHPGQKAIEEEFNNIVQLTGVEMSPEHQKIPVKIIFISPGESITDFWRRTISSFEARMKEIKMNKNDITFS